VPDFELGWWRAIVAASLAHALGEPVHAATEARDFERFFAATFAFYAAPAAWRVLPDAIGAVRALRRRGVTLAVLSNFDGRLHGLLAALGFGDAFAAVVPSSEAGAAKPARAAFEHVRRQVRDAAGNTFEAQQWLHVGDSVREDVAGACDAGWRAAWIDREGDATATLPAGAARITSLAALPELLGQDTSVA
jgi:putative hydrolase of the HAD superfamily